MRPPSGFHRLAALAVLPLALWSALPTIRWCGAGGAEIQLACFIPCVLAAGEPDVSGCEGEARCSATADAGADEPCGDRAACPDGAETPCGLAFCLDGPTGGDGVPSDGPTRVEPPSVFAAVLIAALTAPAAPDRWIGTPSPEESTPASPARAPIHPARGPPASA